MKAPFESLVLEKHLIKLYNEHDYKLNSADNLKSYDKVFINGDESIPTSLIGIEIYESDFLVSSCLIAADGGGTGVNPNSSLISYGGIVICCSSSVFKLTIPTLNLEWVTKADPATCFGIHYLDDDYLVHGELELTRLNKNGQIVWQKSGRDIWTTQEGVDDLAIYDNHILATDWSDFTYKFDFDGNLLDEYKVEKTYNHLPNQKESEKKWWQFWR